MRAGPPSPNPRSAPVHSDLARAGRGFVLVFVGALMFFGFVIGSGLLGGIGQAFLGLVFGGALLFYGWRRTDPETRRRYTHEARRFVRRSP